MTQMPRREGEILINGQRHFAWYAVDGEYHCEPCMPVEEFATELRAYAKQLDAATRERLSRNC